MTDDDNGLKPSLRLVSENPNAVADKVAREVQYAKAEAGAHLPLPPLVS